MISQLLAHDAPNFIVVLSLIIFCAIAYAMGVEQGRIEEREKIFIEEEEKNEIL